MTEERRDFLDQLHKATETLSNREASPHTQGSRRPELEIALKDDACEALLANIELAAAAKLHDLILWESSAHEDSACVTPAAATPLAPLESSDSDVKSAAGTVTACTSSDGKLPFFVRVGTRHGVHVSPAQSIACSSWRHSLLCQPQTVV